MLVCFVGTMMFDSPQKRGVSTFSESCSRRMFLTHWLGRELPCPGGHTDWFSCSVEPRQCRFIRNGSPLGLQLASEVRTSRNVLT